MTTVTGLACGEVVELVTDYLEDALPTPVTVVMTAHLSTCPDCSAYVAEMRQTIEILASLTPQPPSDDMSRRLRKLFRTWAERR
jgi:anti-sigma factor RsiW